MLILLTVLILALRSNNAIPNNNTQSSSYSCTNSFRFDQLCPDPRISYYGNNILYARNQQQQRPETLSILLQKRMNPEELPRVSSRPMTESSIKDPSTNSCEFHKSMNNYNLETEVLTTVHVSKSPWGFVGARACTKVVKILHELFDDEDDYDHEEAFCKNQIGIRREKNREGSQGLVLQQDDVVFWHNFTVYTHSVQFTDSISNFEVGSSEEVDCSLLERNYVQVVVVVSKAGTCEVIIQQYKIDKKRSRYGCGDKTILTNNNHGKDARPYQFCGSYDCNDSNKLITSIKLTSKHHHQAQVFNHHGSNHGDDEQYSSGEEVYGTLGPCESSSENSLGVDEDGIEEDQGSRGSEDHHGQDDWIEVLFLLAFPVAGLVFIVIILTILRSKSTRVICRGYSYDTPTHPAELPQQIMVQREVQSQSSCDSVDYYPYLKEIN